MLFSTNKIEKISKVQLTKWDIALKRRPYLSPQKLNSDLKMLTKHSGNSIGIAVDRQKIAYMIVKPILSGQCVIKERVPSAIDQELQTYP